MQIGRALQSIRKQRGLATTELADRCGVGRFTLKNMEMDRGTVKMEYFEAIAQVLKIPTSLLFLMSIDPKAEPHLYKKMQPIIEEMLKKARLNYE